MSNWIVKVKTQTGYVKDVLVEDYIYPKDAVEAALAQTGAEMMISYKPAPVDKEPLGYSPTSNVGSSNQSSNFEFGPKFSSADKLQTIGIMVGGLIVFVLFPPLAIVAAIVFFVKLYKVNSSN
jgi:hypothetical protein